MQRAREIARLRTTLVGAELTEDDYEEERRGRRSGYRTRSRSRTNSRAGSRETRSQSRHRLQSSDDDEEKRPYARAYVQRSRKRSRSHSHSTSTPLSTEVAVKGAKKKEELIPELNQVENGSYEECTIDGFCWVCHRAVDPDNGALGCVTCARRFHAECVGRTGAKPSAWSCPECALELASDQAENRSWAMRQISVTQLGTLLKFAVKEMQQRVKSSELFAAPVSLKTHPSYRKFVLRPVDLSELSSRVDSLSYGSPAGFLADAKYILHNSVVFNGTSSGVTRIARRMLAICASQMDEIETCPECYLRAHTQEDWFTGVCASPHLLVWAKSGRYPFWPAKVVKVRGQEVDCRFFGAHEKALIPPSLVFLFSTHPPTGPLRSSGQLAEAIEECHTYISNLQRRHGLFVLARNQTILDIDKLSEQLAIQLPKVSLQAKSPTQAARLQKYDITSIKREQTPDPTSANLSTNQTPDPMPANPSTNQTPDPTSANPSTNQTPDPTSANPSTIQTPDPTSANPSTNQMQEPMPANPSTNQTLEPMPANPSTNQTVGPTPANPWTNKTPDPMSANPSTNQTPTSLPSDSMMSDLQRLDALHRELLEAEPQMVDSDDSSTEEARTWHPTSPLAAKNIAVSPLVGPKTPPVSPLGGENAEGTRVSSIPLTDVRSLIASVPESPQIRTVDIKSLMPGSASPPRATNQPPAEPVFTLVSPAAGGSSHARMILVATSKANQFVSVSNAGAGNVTYTLCHPSARQVTLTQSGNKYISVVPAINKTVASTTPSRIGVAVAAGSPAKPVAMTTVKTLQPISAGPMTTAAKSAIGTNSATATKLSNFTAVKAVPSSPVTAMKPIVVATAANVKALPNVSPSGQMINVASLQKIDSVSIANQKSVTSVPSVMTLYPVAKPTAKQIIVTTVQTVASVTGNSLSPARAGDAATTSAAKLNTVASTQLIGSAAANPPSTAPIVTTISVLPIQTSVSAAGPVSEPTVPNSRPTVSTPSCAIPAASARAVPLPVATPTNSSEDILTLVPTKPATAEVLKVGENEEGLGKISMVVPKKMTDVSQSLESAVLTLVPEKVVTVEGSKTSEAEILTIEVVPKKVAATKVPKRVANVVVAKKAEVTKNPSGPSSANEMPAFETVFLPSAGHLKTEPKTFVRRKPVASQGIPSSGPPKLLYVSSAIEPGLKRMLPKSNPGEYTILTKAEYESSRKRRRFEFDPTRPLTLVEHPPPGVKATPLPLGANPQAASRATPVMKTVPVLRPGRVAPVASKAGPSTGSTLSKASVTARKSISGGAVTIAPRVKTTEGAATANELQEIASTAASSSGSGKIAPQDKTLAELGAQAFADFYKRFLDVADEAGHPEAKLKKKQLDLERCLWRATEQLAEQRSAHLLMLNERFANFRNQLNTQVAEIERLQREMDDVKKEYKTQLAEAKKKQWCAACPREAKFHCCWNTSYCAKPCQLTHWTKHNTVCKNRQVRRPSRVSQTGVSKEDVRVREEGELAPEAAAARKVALDNAARVIESVANSGPSSIDETADESRTSVDLPDQSQLFIDFADLPRASIDATEQSRGQSRGSVDGGSSVGEEPGLYMECVNDCNDSNQSISSLGSVRVVSVRSIGDDHAIWGQKASE